MILNFQQQNNRKLNNAHLFASLNVLQHLFGGG